MYLPLPTALPKAHYGGLMFCSIFSSNLDCAFFLAPHLQPDPQMITIFQTQERMHRHTGHIMKTR